MNMFGQHPPFQMDANFGVTAGIAEMLIQSHQGFIELLPALPKEWPDGEVKGLRARGGFEVDMKWQSGNLISANIKSVLGKKSLLRYRGKDIDTDIKTGEWQKFDFNK
jgi:alpha-L-fucosidase 2